MLTFNPYLLTSALIDKAVSAMFCNFLVYADKSLASLSFSMSLHCPCECFKSAGQIRTSFSNHYPLLASINYVIIDICLKTAIFSYHRVYLIFPMASLISFTHFLLSTPPSLPILCSPTLRTKRYKIIVLIYL